MAKKQLDNVQVRYHTEHRQWQAHELRNKRLLDWDGAHYQVTDDGYKEIIALQLINAPLPWVCDILGITRFDWHKLCQQDAMLLSIVKRSRAEGKVKGLKSLVAQMKEGNTKATEQYLDRFCGMDLERLDPGQAYDGVQGNAAQSTLAAVIASASDEDFED